MKLAILITGLISLLYTLTFPKSPVTKAVMSEAKAVSVTATVPTKTYKVPGDHAEEKITITEWRNGYGDYCTMATSSIGVGYATISLSCVK